MRNCLLSEIQKYCIDHNCNDFLVECPSLIKMHCTEIDFCYAPWFIVVRNDSGDHFFIHTYNGRTDDNGMFIIEDKMYKYIYDDDPVVIKLTCK